MLRIFRNARQQLLQNGATLKYFKYAFGEVFLVVIGILLALQINNWNENRKLQNKELTLLREMQSNLNEDLLDFDFNIKGTKMRLLANEVVLQVLEDSLPLHDSLKTHFANFVGGYQLTENTGAFDNLKSIGFDLVRNDSLRARITRLYSNRYVYLNNLEIDMVGAFQMNDLMPAYRQNFTTGTFWKSAHPNDLAILSKNHEFKELLRTNIFFQGYMLNQYQIIRSDAQALGEAIGKELESRK
jgi:hypothetical protein